MARGVFAGGTGTSADPFLIEDADDLNAIRSNLTASYKLINNINLGVAPYNIGKGWAPIHNFKGQLNGNGKKIFNLYIYRVVEDCVGLFGYVTMPKSNMPLRVWDLAIENANIIGRNQVGILQGNIDATGGETWTGPIIFTRVSVSGSVKGAQNVGGLIGRIYTQTPDGWGNSGGVGANYTFWQIVDSCIAKANIICYDLSNPCSAGVIGIVTCDDATFYRSGYSATAVAYTYAWCKNSISLCTFENSNGQKKSSSIMNVSNNRWHEELNTNLYDSNLLNGFAATPNTVGKTTVQLKSGDISLLSYFFTTKDNGRNTWRVYSGKYPELDFMNKNCFFVQTSDGCYTWDKATELWVKRFVMNTLPSTAKIYEMGMERVDNIETKAWNALKSYGKIDIINFVEATDTYITEYSDTILQKTAEHPLEDRNCFSKTFNFADFNDDITNIAP